MINKLPLWQFFLRLSLSAISLHFNSFLSVVYVATMKTKPTINSYAISLCCIHTATIALHRITTGQLTNTHIAFRSPSLSTLKLTMRKKQQQTKRACSIGLLLGYIRVYVLHLNVSMFIYANEDQFLVFKNIVIEYLFDYKQMQRIISCRKLSVSMKFCEQFFPSVSGVFL